MNLCTVRLTTSMWKNERGLHFKKSLTYLKRQCAGFNILEEDTCSIGAEEVVPRIINLLDVPDGIYQVATCNESKDWETGFVDDYDYLLVAISNKSRETEKC